MPIAAHAASAPADYSAAAMSSSIPAQLDAAQRAGYRAVFQSIRDQRWQDAQLQLDAMKPGPLHAIARAEMLTAKGSPKADLDPLVKLLAEAPELPQAQRISSADGNAVKPAGKRRPFDGIEIDRRARIVSGDVHHRCGCCVVDRNVRI